MKRIHSLAVLLFALTTTHAAGPPAEPLLLPEGGLEGERRILHALNRLGFGPRPGDVERIGAVGLEAWIEGQLHPERIPDPEVERYVAGFETLSMGPTALLAIFPPPQLLQGIGRQLSSRLGMDETEVHAIFPEIQELDQRKQAEQDGRETASVSERDRARRILEGPGRIMVELSQAKLLRAVYSERQLLEVMTDFWFNHFNVYAGKGTERWWVGGYEYEAIRPHALGRFRDLLGATAEHPAMLFYLDNWLSVAPGTNVDRRTMLRYGSEATTRQGLPPGGVATLILRDRGMDTSDVERRIAMRDARLSDPRRRGRMQAPRGDGQEDPRKGLNENYARELLELHTLGVDGGYTQEDIVEVARCFTGWTLLPLPAGQGFVFVDEFHDRGKKVVLGKKIEGRGVEQGQAVLDMLANHPSTARFVSTKLARRFVSDDPSAALIDRMTATFLATDGEIRQVLRTLFLSEEFWSNETARAKLKSPFEFMASMLRATDAEIADLPDASVSPGASMTAMGGERAWRRSLPGALHALRQMGQPLYGAEPPTGYGDTAEDWVSAGNLMLRFKVAAGLAAGRLPGVRSDVGSGPRRDEAREEYLRRLAGRLLGAPPSPSTLEALTLQLERPEEALEVLGPARGVSGQRQVEAVLATAWLLASPEFQRR